MIFNDAETEFTELPADDADAEVREDGRLWRTDTGTAPLEVRRALVALLKGPYLSSKRQTKLWNTLVVHKDLIRERLADFCVELVVDERLQLAFVKNAVAEDQALPQLLRSYRLKHLQTMLLVWLRQLHLSSAATNEVTYVGFDEIFEQASLYLHQIGVVDQVAQKRRVNAAITKLTELNLLEPIPGTDRYLVADIIALLATPEYAGELLQKYCEFAEQSASELQAATFATDDDEEEEDAAAAALAFDEGEARD